ncbi:myosin VA [Aphelenchoides avenae]|nr:myosin VA [Aphelenchus avenae]
MLRIKENQCVVISGESGSGKTESTNFLLHHLTTLSQKGSSTGSSIEQMLLSAGPVLEAFGNAVTVQNNNSSRFGKFIKVNYRENGMVSGANVEIYLLEKSRIISQAIGERNYHVFYYLLEGATDEERKKHFLLQPKDYYYLNQNSFFACESMNERYEYERLKHSMIAVGFSSTAQQKIFGMISAVLLLGNLGFIKRPGYHSDENAYIDNEELIGIISELLSIKAQQLHQALTMRRTVLKHDTVITRYNVAEAVNTRDAMAKCLYNALFHWIVLRMNQALIRRETSTSKAGYYIGILDIFGFEDVGAEWNSFEQLCINYANEHLQAYFNQHIFQFEQAGLEYLKEGIAWTNIEYTDNTECVQLFQSKPYGLFRLVDEESNINNGTDKSMLDKLNTFLKTNEYYEIPHKREDAFIIAHYAGKVKYQITGFREKNKDLMRQDVMVVLKNSKSAFVRELIGDDPVAAVKEIIGKKPVTNKPTSVSRQFEYSLSRLMKTLSQATPYFIRCIKSNNEKIPNLFDDNIILRQLRYTGMLETVRIRRAGYSVRIEYDSFVNQYRILLPQGRTTTRADIEQFFKDHPLIDTENVQHGNTKALARGAILRSALRRRHLAALCIQTNWRRYVEQKKYRQARNTILQIQAIARGRASRQRFAEVRAQGPPPRKPLFSLTKFNTISLQHFDLKDPRTLAPFASEDDGDVDTDSDFTGSMSTIEDEDDVFDENETLGVVEEENLDSDIDLDATFILEDTRLKLIGYDRALRLDYRSWLFSDDQDKQIQRRQSLATTASTAKLKLLRRAASTESDQRQRQELGEQKIQSPSAKAKSRKMGFTKARKHLKALLLRKTDDTFSEDENVDPQTSISTDPEKRSAEPRKGHNFKTSRLHKGEACALCNKILTGLLLHGYKCSTCKLSFHKECSSFAANIPCSPPINSPARSDSSTPVRKPWEIIVSKTPRQSMSPLTRLPQASFSLTKTKQQTDPTALIIQTTDDLRQFSVFIFKKQCQLDQEKKRETVVDAIFKKSLREFHMELLGCEAVSEESASLKYRDLITIFEGVLTKVCTQEKITFPTTLGVNAFRGFLNEFMQQQTKRKTSNKTSLIKSVRKKRRRSDVTLHNGHRFRLDFVHVPTYCELCNQFMWHAEKIFICMNCRLSCHKKCHTKVTYKCTKATKGDSDSCGRVFGADLSLLVDDEQAVPAVLNKMFMAIEVQALFIEGIYRKSGAFAAVRNARKAIEMAPNYDDLSFDDVPVHVVTTLIKAFFRELSEPLITYELYENFINVSEVPDQSERGRCLSNMVDLLPKANKCVLDRLMYHLARVAHQESVNKMSASNLALIFAPCILRRSQTVHAQEQLADVQKQAICVQTLVEEKLRQYRATLNQIVEVEHASEKVSENIRKIEEHRRASDTSDELRETHARITGEERSSSERRPGSRAGSVPNMETARQLFEEQLDFLGKEKSKLIQELPPLAPVASSEDLSSSDVDQNSPSPQSTATFNDEYAIDLCSPPVLGRLRNLGKTRPRRRGIRPPSSLHLHAAPEKFSWTAGTVVFRLSFDDAADV